MSTDLPRSPSPTGLPAAADEETPPSVWLLIWTIYLAKLATIILVIWASHSYQTTALIAATTWPWLVVAGALGLGPFLFHLRLRRVRARREHLKRAEWMLRPNATPSSPQPSPHGRP
ncbi:MAG: hypothetical protein QOF33_1516 [Thermomicrobiales bacterium]|jgi:hypothetical protein|nr:hypothetical protein [Thermomicrobiales bacterium]MEA2583431.1 hypothetical protein [Thermomicrobiales bacterium]MEA2594256.1 hypothetical protein [Thermomicrobiales bacterium]